MMTLQELRVREQAQMLNQIDQHEILVNFLFEQRAVQAADKNGKFIILKPEQLYHFTAAKAHITGEDINKVNKMTELAIRAKQAREKAEQQINEERWQSNG